MLHASALAGPRWPLSMRVLRRICCSSRRCESPDAQFTFRRYTLRLIRNTLQTRPLPLPLSHLRAEGSSTWRECWQWGPRHSIPVFRARNALSLPCLRASKRGSCSDPLSKSQVAHPIQPASARSRSRSTHEVSAGALQRRTVARSCSLWLMRSGTVRPFDGAS